jgi:hypothetical protein
MRSATIKIMNIPCIRLTPMVVRYLQPLVVPCFESGGTNVCEVELQRLSDLGPRWRVTCSCFTLEAIRSDGEPSKSQT